MKQNKKKLKNLNLQKFKIFIYLRIMEYVQSKMSNKEIGVLPKKDPWIL
jgi:hypothetical protein